MPTAVTLIRSDELFAAEYAYAASVASDSRLIFFAGACPLEGDGTTSAPGDYRAQAAKCVENLRLALVAANATLRDVVSTRVLVATSDRGDLGAAWAVVREAFGDHDVPSTLLGVTVLGYEGQLVELEAIAAVCP